MEIIPINIQKSHKSVRDSENVKGSPSNLIFRFNVVLMKLSFHLIRQLIWHLILLKKKVSGLSLKWLKTNRFHYFFNKCRQDQSRGKKVANHIMAAT